jgi:uncharacterized protein (DUF305 family)
MAVAASAAVAAITVISLAACSSDSNGNKPSGTPTDTSPEAGFARDMSVHHAQAVAMAEAIRDRTTDPDLKLLATNIALGQQAQIGRMSGWLDEWGLTISSVNSPMAWMTSPNHDMDGMDGMDMGSPDLTNGLMPGMATRPQVTALSTLPLDEAEISFLQLMIAHHKGGVEMAHAILERTDRPDVVKLATSMVNGQQAEIELMTDMLAKRGITT